MFRILIVLTLSCQLVSSDTLDCLCGKEAGTTRIVNGRPVTQGTFPWMVALATKVRWWQWWNWGRKPYFQFCGGTLINDRWILTAAHCVPKLSPSSVYVIKEQVNIKNVDSSNVLKVDKIWSHAEYVGGSNSYRNDIALLRLSKPVTFTQKFSPICLPSKDMRNFDNLFNIGWGRTVVGGDTSEELLYIDTQQRHDCEILYKSLFFWSKQICISAYRRGVCQGDSGGPLSTRKNGYVTQVGVNSWVIGGTCGYYPDVTTRVSDYLTEIEETTAGSKWCRNPNLGQ